jgi:hypothetical protein
MASDSLDQRVREALDRSLAERQLQLEADPVAAVRHRVARRGRRRRVMAGIAIAGIVVLVSSALLVSQDGGERDQDLEVTGPSATEPGNQTGAIVSQPDGVEPLPEPPIEVRGDAAVVWTGAELVVWGGDGAAFAPTTDTWRMLSSSPLPNNSDTPVGVMTSAGVVIARGRSTALWNPEDDTWRDVEDAPGPVSDLASNGVLAISYSANAILDTATGQWRELSAPPVRLERPTTAWTGRELIVIGGAGSAFTSASAIGYDLESDEWRQLASPPGQLHAEALSADWDGERVVVVNYDMTAATYDPTADSWEDLPAVPARFYEWYPTLRSSGGRSVAFMATAIVVLGEDGHWVPLPYGDIPFGAVATTRPGFGVASGDGTVFIWSLNSDRATNTLTAVDVNRLVGASRRIQVGIGSIELGAGASLVDSAYTTSGTEEEVRAVIQQGDGSRCAVSSGYGTVAVEQPVEKTLDNDGRPTPWKRDPGGRIWQTAATTSDVFTIDCDQAEGAETMANSASFGEQ